MTELRLGWATHEAAEYAVRRWHYSGILPTGKLVCIGVWEGGGYIGVVIFSRGASPYLGAAYDLDATELCELTRVALSGHVTPVSQIVAGAIRMLRESNPGLRLIVSFADPNQGHRGGIYQAGNWIYTGRSNDVVEYRIGGRWRHTRGAYWDPRRQGAAKRTQTGKHRYLMPLDKQMRRQLRALVLPFPKHADEGSTVS